MLPGESRTICMIQDVYTGKDLYCADLAQHITTAGVHTTPPQRQRWAIRNLNSQLASRQAPPHPRVGRVADSGYNRLTGRGSRTPSPLFIRQSRRGSGTPSPLSVGYNKITCNFFLCRPIKSPAVSPSANQITCSFTLGYSKSRVVPLSSQSHHPQFHCRPMRSSAVSLLAQIKSPAVSIFTAGQSNNLEFQFSLSANQITCSFIVGQSNNLRFHCWRPIKSPAVSLFTVGQSNNLQFHCRPIKSPAVSGLAPPRRAPIPGWSPWNLPLGQATLRWRRELSHDTWKVKKQAQY